MRPRTWLVLLAIVGAGALSACRLSHAPAGARASPAELTRPAWIGTTSCAAAACHGAGGPKGSARSEYNTWATYDPHARAFDVLREPRSDKMVQGLGLKAATEEALCLNCHVRPGYDPATASPGFHKEAGVGCESCHGPAGPWADSHYRSADAARTGMADTKSLLGRAGVCVRCHVGTPGAEVNHDLIAVGHPPLRFEFAAYHANLPRHWDDTKDQRDQPDFEARAWALGQAESARAALALLAARAASARSWPEFADFSCFACHHDLPQPSARQQREGDHHPARKLMPWQTWYLAMVPQALAVNGDGATATEALRELRVGMEARKALIPSAKVRSDLGEQATRTAGLLRPWAETLPKPLPVTALTRLLRTERVEAEYDWDHAAQLYLALAAMKQTDADVLWHQLRFPPGYLSPKR